MTSFLIAIVVYPGLLCALALGWLFGLISAERRVVLRGRALLRDLATVLALLALFAAALASALLPWPFSVVSLGQGWMWAWAALELAFLLPFLPSLLSGAPPTVRRALREAQIGVAARAVLWLALGVLYALGARWELTVLPTRLLASFVVMLAYPAAIAWGPFSGAEELVAGSAEASAETQSLLRFVGDVRAAVLLVAALIAVLPIALAPSWLALAMLLIGLVSAALVLRRFSGVLPRLTIQAALGYCLRRLLPLGLVAVALAAFFG
jgi:hypothetical protein